MLISGGVLINVLGDVDKSINSDNVQSSKGSTLRSPYGRAGKLINLINAISTLEHNLDNKLQTESTNSIGNEVWSIFGHDCSLPQSLINNLPNGLKYRRQSVFCRNKFQEFHIARRIEKMSP